MMSKSKALAILRSLKEHKADFSEEEEAQALDFAMRAIEVYQDRKALASKGGTARAERLSKKELSRIGKLGGRTPVKKPGYMTLKKRESRQRQKKQE